MSTGELIPAVAPLAELALDELALQAKAELAQAESALQTALGHALNAGDALAAAKAQLAHGEWERWVRENVGIHPSTASNYMRLAANRERVADLQTVKAALKALAGRAPRQIADVSGEEEMALSDGSPEAPREVECPRCLGRGVVAV